nr:hypothetical protein [Candidatus Sigynarchaeota archaeon]
KVQARSKPHHVVGKGENYIVVTVYRRCGNSMCPGCLKQPIAPKNPYVLLNCEFDIEVQALVCELRFKYHRTDVEITDILRTEHGIWMDASTAGDIIRMYEIGCSQKYKPETIEKMKANGGIMITMDAMEPLKGEPPIYMIRDEFTGTKLGAKQLPNKKEATIEIFVKEVKARIATELGVEVVGIMSDAEKELVKALQNSFPGVPLCSCEYHFYQDVLDAPLAADSHVITTIRAILRNLTDVKAFKARGAKVASSGNGSSIIDETLEVIYSLSNWTKKPRDPAFSGLELHRRVVDIAGIVREMHAEVRSSLFTKDEEKSIIRIKTGLDKCIAKTRRAARGLEHITEYLKEIVSILDNDEESADVGLQRLRAFKDTLVKAVQSNKVIKFEQLFIEALDKYVETKGERLLAHRNVKGAPRTNNNHELEHLRVKHLLRRTIGHSAASYYLLVHGEHLVFVKPDESRENIEAILRNMNRTAAKEIMAVKRKPRTAISIIMHVADKWKEKINQLRVKLVDLKRAKTIRT